MNNLTVEQMEKIHKLHKRFMFRAALLTFLYLTGFFVGNVITTMIDLEYIKNPLFISATSFGAAIIFMTGLRCEIEKAYSEMKSEVDKISKGSTNEK